MSLKEPIWIAGTMSGTSLDGVDVACVRTDGRMIYELGGTVFRPYTAAEQKMLRAELGTWQASEALCEMIETAHVEALSQLSGFEAIGFHGQTLNHAPDEGRTYQAGDGALLAQVFGVPCVWDFRSTDIKMGGQGAPLAPFYHHALAQSVGLGAPVGFLNLGGVGNITWTEPTGSEESCVAFDTGPANAPINDAMQARFAQAFDAEGAVAARGAVDEAVLAQLLDHPYFLKMPPKSLDRDSFAGLLTLVNDLPDEDAIATLTGFAARAVAAGLAHLPTAPKVLYVCGGGRHNKTLMSMLAQVCAAEVRPIEALEIEEVPLDGDFIEAQAFAYLAARVLAGLPTSAPGTTGVPACVGGGQISRV